MSFTLYQGDCIEVMRGMADNSVDSIVTDPPYELGFMGKAWDATGVANNPVMWLEALRVLKPGGHLLAFSGSRTYHRMVCAVEDAGFDIRDQIMWIYGSGFPKSHNLDGDHEGWGTALKPAHEPIVVARKPLIGTVAANVLAHGTGAINIDGCRIGWPNGVAPEIGTAAWGGPTKKSTVVPGQDGATVEREPPSALGRWPANVIHDGSLEVLAGFPETKSGGYPPAGGQRSQAATYGKPNERGLQVFTSNEGSAARFFYTAKASKSDRHEGLAIPGNKFTHGGHMREVENMGADRGGNHHPTVKPTDLMAYLCRLVTPPGGTVLDPFMGSGSTGKACALEGFSFIGIDLSAEYLEIARARISHADRQDKQPSLDLEAA